MIVSVDSVPVWKLAVSEAVIVPDGDQFAAVDQFLFAPPPVHVNVSAHDGDTAAVTHNATTAILFLVRIFVYLSEFFTAFLTTSPPGVS